ncbi:MAG: hypothetical protein M3Y71_09875 [Actinomycetota bacterium]|nr:hypothetical protein [Actinomycetota bacterium]
MAVKQETDVDPVMAYLERVRAMHPTDDIVRAIDELEVERRKAIDDGSARSKDKTVRGRRQAEHV